ncbi:glycosyltransferase [Acetobacter tropicalis]|uniref:Lipopolysaccharide biosynthesis protein n=1 Tax=Acetobacter tropicalis TaxID=104102 RepID=A0A252A756_9PROT|nr:glycosyltransferase [Acetobacter tropicalis]OUI85367.1 lipopolysaccharide biosynthesis protein [Acetobacter tropicalis]
MRVLVWQWGRRGAGPKMAVELARGLNALEGCQAVLSLSEKAEILRADPSVTNDLSVRTYTTLMSLLGRVLQAPWLVRQLTARVRRIRPDLAICAMPGPLDLLMAQALRRAGVPVVVIVHDAQAHPGDGFPGQIMLQRLLVWRAEAVVALTTHVAALLEAQRCMRGRKAIVASHPPFAFEGGTALAQPLAHGGSIRLLAFGRLLPYKGLDLLADALQEMGQTQPGYVCRVVGKGPDAPWLHRLAHVPGVSVENRWVPEGEIASLLAWADVLLLPYREASQSGVGAAALAAGRWVLATNVGGLAEQFRSKPQAVLCAPTSAGIAQALRQMIAQPPPVPEPEGNATVKADWASMAGKLLSDLWCVLPHPAGSSAAGPVAAKPAPRTKS